MVSSMVITWREGFEASLIISILLAYLNRTDNRQFAREVWAGTLGAIALSLLLGLAVFAVAGGISGPAEEAFEGLAMAVAAGVLTFMIWWMRQQSRFLRRELEHQVTLALERGSAIALATLAFVSVLREGAETVLFLVAATEVSSPLAMGIGSGAGLLLAIAFGWLVYRGAQHLPLRTFFDVTSIALIVFAAGLIGRATMAFQSIGVFPGTITAWDTSWLVANQSLLGSILGSLVGYVATPTVLQITFYLAYLALTGYLFFGAERILQRGATTYGDPFVPLWTDYRQGAYSLVRQRWIPNLVAGAMLVLFVLLMVVGLFSIDVGPFDNQGFLRLGPFASQENGNNLFNFALWILWFPLLSLSAVFVGRFWCGNLCPLRLVTDWASSLRERLFGVRSSPSPYLRMGWLLPTAFVLITLYAISVSIQQDAQLGARMFLAISLGAAAVGFLLRQGTWCRYLCPIGGWLARLARLSVVSLRPDSDACVRCIAKPCLTGGTVAPRCPTFLNPSRLESNRYCLACWNCVKNCPAELSGMRLGLRFPGAELLRPYAPDPWEAAFVAALMGMYMAVVAGAALWPDVPWAYTFFGLIAAAVAVYIGLSAAAGYLGGLGFREALAKVGYIALPLEFAAAILAMGDDALEFFQIREIVAGTLLPLGFVWSVLLAASILRNNCADFRRAVQAAVPIATVLIGVLFLWMQWFVSGTVIDVT
ncbi:MAG: FTR1 family protein [Chloroflexi bacterium]|nr:FTR1 family protein [Chloroflexota bacterium]